MSESAAASRPPEVDFIPSAVPSPPPPPPPHARVSNPGNGVKISVQGNLEQVVDSMTNLRGSQHAALNTPGVHRRNLSNIQFLNDLVNDPDKVGFRLEIRRRGPAIWEGSELPAGVVDRCDPMAYQDVLQRTRELNGGGDYSIMVLNEEGRSVNQFPFRIDVITDPPKMPRQSISAAQQRSPMSLIGGINRTPGSTVAVGEEDAVVLIRAEERRVAAEMALKAKKREAELSERRQRLEDEMENERRDKIAQQPIQAANAQMSAMERQLIAMQQNFSQMMQQQQQQTQQLILSMTQKPVDNSQTQIMIESMKNNQAMMLAMMNMAQQNAQTKSTEQLAAVNMQALHQKEIMELAVKSASGGNSRYDKLIESMLNQQMNKPQDTVKQALDLIETGRRQTMEMLDMRNEYGSNDEDMDYDPEAGVLGNLGKVAFTLLKQMLKGGGGAAGLAQVLSLLGKSSPEQVSTKDLSQLARTMEMQQKHQPQLQQRPQVQAPPPLGIPAFGPPSARPVVQPQAPTPVAPPQPRRIMLRSNPDAVEAYVEEALEEETPAAPVAAAAVPVIPGTTPVAPPSIPVDAQVFVNTRLSSVVTEAMRQAIEDLNEGTREHDWPDFAIAKWPKNFLDAFAQATDDAQRVELIRNVCDPTVFAAVYGKFIDPNLAAGYQAFVEGMRMVVQEHVGIPVAAN